MSTQGRSLKEEGRREGEAGEMSCLGVRFRKARAGRKKVVQMDAALRADLQGIRDPKGDSMSFLTWTTRIVAHLKKALHEQGQHLADPAV